MIKIYKKDSKGKIRVYETYTNDDKLIQRTGLLNGNLVENKTICTPKNVGKSNETSGEKQAEIEMGSRIDKKLKSGYFLTVKEAEDEIVILPMLAKSYENHNHKIVYPCHAQPKLDGMRASINKDGIRSRKGISIKTMDHIYKELKEIVKHQNLILDGELYSHGLSFQDNMKLIKKYREGSSENVKYHVYDCMIDLPFRNRYLYLQNVASSLKHIEIVKTIVINSEKDLKEFHAKNLGDGYEGTMVRWSDEIYKMDSRSDKLLKYKDFLDDVFEVVNIVPSKRRPEQGIVVCKHNEYTFKATPKMSHEDREDLLNNKSKYIGEIAEVRYFELTDKGIPRFPICVGFRLDVK